MMKRVLFSVALLLAAHSAEAASVCPTGGTPLPLVPGDSRTFFGNSICYDANTHLLEVAPGAVVSIASATINASGHLILTRTDGTTLDAGALPSGTGVGGISVTSLAINGAGHMIVTLSSGATVDAGLVPAGPQGIQGAQGPIGPVGPAGAAGAAGAPGQSAPLGVAAGDAIDAGSFNKPSGPPQLDTNGLVLSNQLPGSGLFAPVLPGPALTAATIAAYSDLAAFFDVSAGSAYSDTGCTVPQTTNGGVVNCLKDLTGKGNNFVALSTAEAPTYVANGPNGQPVIACNAANSNNMRGGYAGEPAAVYVSYTIPKQTLPDNSGAVGAAQGLLGGDQPASVSGSLGAY